MIDRNIGIISDGPTDWLIFRKLVETIVREKQPNTTLNFVQLKRQSLRDQIDRYWQEASRENNYHLPAEPANHLLKEVVGIIRQAFHDFENESGVEGLSARDMLIVTTDTERAVKHSRAYFEESWTFSLSKILVGAVEQFYQLKVQENYPYEYLPFILPLAVFPSTEILVAVAKNHPQSHYGKSPQELKRILYNTDDLRTLRPGELEKRALDVITPERVNAIFNQIPESRPLIQTLSFGRTRL